MDLADAFAQALQRQSMKGILVLSLDVEQEPSILDRLYSDKSAIRTEADESDAL